MIWVTIKVGNNGHVNNIKRQTFYINFVIQKYMESNNDEKNQNQRKDLRGKHAQ